MSDFTHVACPLCLAKNRLPAHRLADGATCGKCGAPLFNNRPVELNAHNFDRIVNNSDIPVLVDFWAPWCGPCKMMAPVFEQAAKQLEPNVRLGKLNTENEQAIAARFGIRSIPTLMMFRNGRPVAQQAGALNLESLVSWAGAQAKTPAT